MLNVTLGVARVTDGCVSMHAVKTLGSDRQPQVAAAAVVAATGGALLYECHVWMSYSSRITRYGCQPDGEL